MNSSMIKIKQYFAWLGLVYSYVSADAKEFLSKDCSRTGGTVGRPRGSKNIKKEPGIEDFDEFDEGRGMDDDDEDYKPELDGSLPLPNAFLNLSNDDIDKELGDQELDDENDP